MADLQGFDASVVEPDAGFPVLPAGEYDVAVIASESKVTKAGTGKYLSLTMQVLGGEHQNKKLFDNINYVNPNADCQRIGRAALSALCRAVDVLKPNDSSELHMKPLRVRVVIVDDQNYGKKNEVKEYKPRLGKATTLPNQPPASGSW